MMFATVVSPLHDLLDLSCAFCWLWFHLFQLNVSTQSYSADEDVLNKPCAVRAHQREGSSCITPGTPIFLFELFITF
ncbi:hypothetical protein BDR07DRAFT_1425309 [Suillus spraguei]|nr:hypothetical protein BDR07DRAFT_1425309 [Suillus spraguei]